MFYIVIPLVGIFLPRLAALRSRQFIHQLRNLGLLSGCTIGGTWLIGIFAYPYLFRLFFNLDGNARLYNTLLPLALANTLIYIGVFVSIIRRHYRIALYTTLVGMGGCLIASSLLPRTVLISAQAVLVGSCLGCIYLLYGYRRSLWQLFR